MPVQSPMKRVGINLLLSPFMYASHLIISELMVQIFNIFESATLKQPITKRYFANHLVKVMTPEYSRLH